MILPLSLTVTLAALALAVLNARRRRRWLGLAGIAAIVYVTMLWLPSESDPERARIADGPIIAEALKPAGAPADSPGVHGSTAGPVAAWLAVAPTIAIDLRSEVQLGDEAAREVPIRVVVLNDSYGPLTPDGSETDPLWRLTLSDAQGQVVRAWSGGLAREEIGPAERRDAVLLWDGRDAGGALLSLGAYQLRLRTTPVSGGQAIVVDAPFEIVHR